MIANVPTPIPPKFYTNDAPSPARVEVQPIGIIRSAHKERHGTPRQARVAADPTLRPDERASIELFPTLFSPAAVQDLAGFEYLWIIAWLHLNQGWRERVLVPGRSETTGLFATRAPHRPNPIGLSAVRLLEVDGLCLHVERIDLLDGTPVLDIKPYVPYADAFPDAKAGWIDDRGATPSG